MEAVGTILKVAQQIAKAAETARRNRARCRDLADRARTVGGILRDDTKAGDTAARRNAMGRLKAALEDALRLVESCRQRSGWFAWLTGGRTAARFQDVESRITTCVVDLGIANDARLEKLLNDLAAARRRPGANTRATGSWKKETNRGNAKKKSGAKNGGDDMNRNNGKKKDAVAKNGDRSGGASSGGAAAAAAAGNSRKEKSGRQQQGGGMQGGGRQTSGKAAAPAPPLPHPHPCYVVHVMEEETTACSVM